MTTDTSEKGLEALIVRSLIDEAGYALGNPKDYDRDHAIDLVKLLSFLNATQPETVETLGIGIDGPKRIQFLHRLQGQIARRGVINVLRKGVKHGPASVELFFGTPSPGNTKAEELFARNIFSVTRQVQYSKDNYQAVAGLGALHQRPAHRHVRTQEQSDEADGRGRSPAIQAGPGSEGIALPIRPLCRPFRGG